MIRVSKGCKFGQRDSVTILFAYRDLHLSINNVKRIDDDPYITVDLNKQDARELISWLQNVIEDKRCDECYGIHFPASMSGALQCKHCGFTMQEPNSDD